VGRTIAQYDVLARVGGGGMGVVYRARDNRLGRTVALKFLPPQWSHDEDARQRFIREAQAASATNHQNICTIHDIETAEDGQLFIVMAYYEGRTLKERLASGPLPVEEALDVATQLADGLAKAHAQGIVHRDVKPGNVMLTEDGVRILDFGLATFADALKLTVEHSTLGTAAYMSPEQVRGQSADARSDVWAVGVILYEMLTGHVPFQGSHAEAIGYAVRNEAPAPIGASRPGIGEEVEQLVFRAMHKEPSVRFANGRELARALRHVRGQSLPLDLRTEPVQVDRKSPTLPGQRRKLKGRVAVATALVVIAGAGSVWISWPIERTPVVVVPVINQTGYSELDDYRLALTYELVSRFSDSSLVRVMPYERLMPIISQFRRPGGDVSSLAAIGAIARHSGVTTMVVPTLEYKDRRWKGRIELRNAETGVAEATYETESEASALITETAHDLITPLIERAENHFINRLSIRAYVKTTLQGLGERPPNQFRRIATLDAALEFEQGLNAYGELEYGKAAQFFAQASKLDSSNPSIHAWHSRVLRLMRRDDEAVQAAEVASRMLRESSNPGDRLFIEAIIAESRRDSATAEARYRERVSRDSADANATMELAAFLDRAGRSNDAVAAYLQAISLDPYLYAADVDLCRMYNRLGESLRARDRAERARKNLGDLHAIAGQAQALLCWADSLRSGSPDEQTAARKAVEEALGSFIALDARYNIPRAYNYLATIAGLQRARADARAFGEQALVSAERGGNAVIQPLVLMNLGATESALGNPARAAEYYQRSYQRYRAFGDNARAAEIQANRGALLIDFGPEPEDGLREVNNALEVARQLRNSDFEAFCLYVIAGYYTYSGQRAEAESYLNQVLSIAREYSLSDKIASANVRGGRVAFEVADYSTALDRLTQALQAITDDEFRIEGLIHLARVYSRMGNFAAAGAGLAKASAALQGREAALRPLLQLAQGELAYEMNQIEDARTTFRAGAAARAADQPDAASVESLAHLGALEASAGRAETGRRATQSCVEYSRNMGRKLLEARCRIFSASIDVAARKFAEALATLMAIPDDDAQYTVGPELRAQIHYWRGRAFAGLGNGAAALTEAAAARQLIESIRLSLPEEFRASFRGRPDIQRIVS
jgi:serine/threonine protein kinase/tetratricopeptide (TPR) repeat protein